MVNDKFKAAQANQMKGPAITPEMIRNSQTISCDCGGKIFEEKIIFKKLSAILSPSGKEEVIPMPVIVCMDCGLVPSAFDPQGIIPKELRAVGPEPLPGTEGDVTLKVVK
jgi:hypothetical protein